MSKKDIYRKCTILTGAGKKKTDYVNENVIEDITKDKETAKHKAERMGIIEISEEKFTLETAETEAGAVSEFVPYEEAEETEDKTERKAKAAKDQANKK